MSDPGYLDDDFVRNLTEYQSHLMGYIMASVGNQTNAADILQQTNIVLLRKAKELRSPDEFLPWAISIAKYQVLGFVRDQSRERLVFSPEVTEALSIIAAEKVARTPERLSALRECLGQLPGDKLDLLQQRYTLEAPLQDIAARCQCSIDSVKGKLKRLRELLGRCISAKVTVSGE